VDSDGPKELCIRWGPDPTMESGKFEGESAAHCKVQGRSAASRAKTAEPIEMPFGLWTRVPPRKHVLGEV